MARKASVSLVGFDGWWACRFWNTNGSCRFKYVSGPMGLDMLVGPVGFGTSMDFAGWWTSGVSMYHGPHRPWCTNELQWAWWHSYLKSWFAYSGSWIDAADPQVEEYWSLVEPFIMAWRMHAQPDEASYARIITIGHQASRSLLDAAPYLAIVGTRSGTSLVPHWL